MGRIQAVALPSDEEFVRSETRPPVSLIRAFVSLCTMVYVVGLGGDGARGGGGGSCRSGVREG